MPPKKNVDENTPTQLLKEKLQGANSRDRRNGRANAAGGSGLKEVDNASTNSGQTTHDSTSNVSATRIRGPRLSAVSDTAS
jgi:hypothetical protein